MKKDYLAYLQSEWWKERRQKALENANDKCQLCSNQIELNVHHNCYDNLYQEPDEDLIVLCSVCHERHHEILDEIPIEINLIDKMMSECILCGIIAPGHNFAGNIWICSKCYRERSSEVSIILDKLAQKVWNARRTTTSINR